MPIPVDEKFEEFLAGTRVVDEVPSGSYKLFCGDRRDAVNVPTLYLSYPERELSIDSVLNCIIRDLKSKNSPVNQKIALVVLGLIAESHRNPIGFVSHANNVLNSVKKANLYMHEILDFDVDPRYQTKIKSLEIKSFQNSPDEEQILWWAKRANVAFPPDFLEQIKGRTALRNVQQVEILDWMANPFYKNIQGRWAKAGDLFLIDEYYQQLLIYARKDYALRFNDELALFEAAGFGGLNLESLGRSMWSGKLGLFFWKRDNKAFGWALGAQPVRNANLPPPDKYDNCSTWLKEEFGFCDFSVDFPLDQSIEQYCKILQRAERHGLDGRQDEEFLFKVVALDLLFSDRGESKKISQRAAVITHRQLDMPFVNLEKKIKKLYDNRSKFVHEGRIPDVDELNLLKKICREVLWCLLYVSAQKLYDKLETWIAEIDLLQNFINTGRELEESSLINVGVPPVGKKREPPFQVVGLSKQGFSDC